MKLIALLSISLIQFFTFSQRLIDTVYFDVDEFLLTEDSKVKLSELSKNIENKNIEIAGFTDSTGNKFYNLELSEKRAKSVADYFISNGIESKQIDPIQANGETTSETGLNKNRRVVITLTESNDISKESHISKTKDAELNQTTIDEIKIGEILNLKGLEFHPGRHVLKPYALPKLDELTDLLSKSPKVKIEIQGHICCQMQGDGLDTDTGTYNLSENRAEYIYTELLKRGVSKERLTHKGYGSSRKLEEEVNPDAMQRNRRVSILILNK